MMPGVILWALKMEVNLHVLQQASVYIIGMRNLVFLISSFDPFLLVLVFTDGKAVGGPYQTVGWDQLYLTSATGATPFALKEAKMQKQLGWEPLAACSSI